MADKKIFLIAFVIVGILVAVGFVFYQQAIRESAGSVVQTPGLTEVSMTIFHTGYSPSTIRANLGDTVQISAVTERGTSDHSHGITIDEYGIDRAVTDQANPTVIEFTAGTAGTFSIYCAPCREGIYGAAHPDIRATLVVE